MRFLPANAQHIGSRHYQQDSFGFGDPEDSKFLEHGGFLAVVCDGMGGMEYGDAASRTAVRAFLEAYSRKTPLESIPAALERSVREANHQVVSLALRLGMPEGIGTTLVAAALDGRSLYFASVGDSGLFVSSRGDLQTINHPHVFANLLDAAVARGTMTQEDALAHPERDSLTSFIGASALEEIDRNIEPFPLFEGDTVLLASDGMFKTLSHQEIAECLAGDSQTWPDVLVERTLAKKRESQDNVTVISVTVTGEDDRSEPRTVKMRIEDVAPSASRSTSDWPTPVQSKRAAPKSRSAAWIAVVILCLAIAAAGWWYARRVSAHGGETNSAPEAGDAKGAR